MGPLLVLGVGGILIGGQIPRAFAWAAEMAVGAVLVGLGGHLFWDLWRRRAYRHDARPGTGVAAAGHGRAGRGGWAHGHGPTLVGILHGLAGTAPIFVVLPIPSWPRPGRPPSTSRSSAWPRRGRSV